jgi:hypothetical protein
MLEGNVPGRRQADMRSKLTTLLTVIGAVTVLVLAANTVALATTGKALLAGKATTSSKLTSIVRTTPGTGFQVKTKSAANAPFAVNGKGKVGNLNADLVDGLDSSLLGARTVTYSDNGTQTRDAITAWNVPLAAGATYQLSYDVAAVLDTDATPAAPLVLVCGFSRTDWSLFKGISQATGFLTGQPYYVSGATTIRPTAAGQWMFICQTFKTGSGDATFRMMPGSVGGLHINVTRIAGQSTGNLSGRDVNLNRVRP